MVQQVVDKNGVPINPGQTVLVHQEEEIRKAIVIKPFIDNPTEAEPGHWVDIKIEGRGIDSMMSYILEVI